LAAGGIAGAVVTLVLRDEHQAAPAAKPPAPGERPDGVELAALASELRRIRELLEQPSGPAAPAEREVAPSGSDEALERTLQELVAVLQARSVSPPGSASSAAALLELSAKDAPLRAKVWAFPDEYEGDGPLSRQHRFWSYERVLAAYGAPTGAEVEGGVLKWIYMDEAKQRRVAFEFYDGFVVRCLSESW
jgi:hypothetical protein